MLTIVLNYTIPHCSKKQIPILTDSPFPSHEHNSNYLSGMWPRSIDPS